MKINKNFLIITLFALIILLSVYHFGLVGMVGTKMGTLTQGFTFMVGTKMNTVQALMFF